MGRGEEEGQAFSTESRDWLRSQILGKTVYCQLLKRESMYGRMVGFLLHCKLRPKLEENQIVIPFLPRRILPWWLTGNRGTNLSDESIRRGWAFVYESDAGEFPHPEKREGYLKLMSEAQYVYAFPVLTMCLLYGKRRAKVGMWKSGTSLETPGQYKKRAKQGVAPENTDDTLETSEGEESWFRLKLKDMIGRRG